MTGQIYDIAIQGHHHKKPHPHVVVVELEKECWVVPAFSGQGVEVNMTLDALEVAGFPREHCYVELDNTEHVTWADGRAGKVAKWFVARSVKLSKGQFLHRSPCGSMSDEGLLKLIDTWLRLASKVDRYSPYLCKKLKKLAGNLRAKLGRD